MGTKVSAPQQEAKTCRKQITNKDLPYTTGNCIQYHVTIYNWKESEKEVCVCVCVCVCVTELLCCTPESNTILYINYTSVFSKKNF